MRFILIGSEDIESLASVQYSRRVTVLVSKSWNLTSRVLVREVVSLDSSIDSSRSSASDGGGFSFKKSRSI